MKIVKGEGNKNSKICFVGQAPGAEEDYQGRPFVGAAGQLLDRLCLPRQIYRSDCYITNVIKERPLNNNIKHFFPTLKNPTPKAREYITELWEELEDVKANVIVPLGVEALSVLTGLQIIEQARGRVIETLNGRKCVPTYHPAAVLRNYPLGAIVSLDLRKIKLESESPNIYRPSRELILDPPFMEAMEYLDTFLHTSEYICLDFETARDKPLITRFALANKKDFAVSFPILDPKNQNLHAFNGQQLHEMLQAFESIMLSNKIKKIAHNFMFELYLLKTVLGIYPKNIWMDTMLAHAALFPEFPKNLEFLASIFTSEPPYKKGIDTQARMNAKDAAITFEVAFILDKLLQNKEKRNKTFSFSMSLLEPLLSITLKGVRCDSENKKELTKTYTSKVEELTKKFHTITNTKVNPNSPKQLNHLFYNVLGAPVQHDRKTGSVTTNEAALLALGKKGYHIYTDIILEIRKTQKLLSTYADMRLSEDQRFICSYNIAGTETGRLSSSKLFGVGSNLQNIPTEVKDKAIRDLFIADPGFVMISVDYKQIENMLVAWFAKDPGLMHIFRQGGDSHKDTAALIFNKDIKDVTDTERTLAKRINHAYNYGLGPKTLSDVLQAEGFSITQTECKRLLHTMTKCRGNINRWKEITRNKLKTTKELENPFGRQSLFTDRYGDALFRQAYAFLPQSTAADILNRAMLELYNTCGEWIDILLQVHDELVIQVKVEDKAKAIKAIKKIFEKQILIEGSPLTVPIKITTGQRWGSLEKEDAYGI